MLRANSEVSMQCSQNPSNPSSPWCYSTLCERKKSVQSVRSVSDNISMVSPYSSLCQNGKQVEIITKMIFELCYIEVIKFIHIPCLFDVFEICHRSHSTLCTLFQITEPTKIQVKIGQLILSPLLSYRKVCTFASQSLRQTAPSATWLLQTASRI